MLQNIASLWIVCSVAVIGYFMYRNLSKKKGDDYEISIIAIFLGPLSLGMALGEIIEFIKKQKTD